MIKINSNNGITIISLIITVIVLLILAGTIVSSLDTSDGTANYNKMTADIKFLKDELLIYYNKYEEVPTTDRKINIDGEDYLEIDLQKLSNITLNFGKEYGETATLTNSDDVYVTDKNLNIYYLRGIEKSGTIYHN